MLPRMPISIRLSAEERSTISSRADLDGWSAGGYIREAALRAACGRVPSRHLGRDALARAVASLVSEMVQFRKVVGSIGNSDLRWEVDRLDELLLVVRSDLRAVLRGGAP